MNYLLEGIGISLIRNLGGIVVSHSVRKSILQLCVSFLLDSPLEMRITLSSRQRQKMKWCVMYMLRTENLDEQIIALDHIGTYRTPRGVIKVLVVTIREKMSRPKRNVKY